MTYRRQRPTLVLICLLGLGLFLAACGSDEDIEAAWGSSAHADTESRAFSRWNDSDPPEISPNCAKCHSTPGYLDFLGADGSTPGQVDHPAPVGTTVECEVCHNDVTAEKEQAAMPSGVTLTGLGSSTNCMECHQGRTSGVSVTVAIAGKEDDTVDAELGLPNMHNNPAGPTQYGVEAHGGFEYPGANYSSRYQHVIEIESCVACHDAHALQVKVASCGACHLGVTSVEDLSGIRVSNIDYDGDGDNQEGISGEIETMQERLLASLKVYTAQTEAAARIDYEGGFVDANGESYSTFTPRSLRAAYNYDYSVKNAGGYAHNSGYVLQLLYDSIVDLGFELGNLSRPEVQ